MPAGQLVSSKGPNPVGVIVLRLGRCQRQMCVLLPADGQNVDVAMPRTRNMKK